MFSRPALGPRNYAFCTQLLIAPGHHRRRSRLNLAGDGGNRKAEGQKEQRPKKIKTEDRAIGAIAPTDGRRSKGQGRIFSFFLGLLSPLLSRFALPSRCLALFVPHLVLDVCLSASPSPLLPPVRLRPSEREQQQRWDDGACSVDVRYAHRSLASKPPWLSPLVPGAPVALGPCDERAGAGEKKTR